VKKKETECLQRESDKKRAKGQNNLKMPKNNNLSTHIQWWRDRIERSIAKSRTKSSRGGNYVQLATIGYKKSIAMNLRAEQIPIPENRCVVFRGFCPDYVEKFVNSQNNDFRQGDMREKPMMLKMITDKRSAKAQQILENFVNGVDRNPAELVWWFSLTSEQYRIAGELFLVGGSSKDTTEGVICRV